MGCIIQNEHVFCLAMVKQVLQLFPTYFSLGATRVEFSTIKDIRRPVAARSLLSLFPRLLANWLNRGWDHYTLIGTSACGPHL